MRPLTNTRGFTIMELLVAMTVAVTFALAGWTFQRSQMHEFADQASSIGAAEKIRAAMAFIADEIRQAGSDPMLTALVVPGNKGISVAGSDRISIELDANGDGTLDPTLEDPFAESILYTFDTANGRIQRTVAGVTQELVSDVPLGGFSLEYFDILGNPIAFTGNPPLLDDVKRDLVAFVRLRLRVAADGGYAPNTLELASRVTVRNRVLDRL